MFFCLLFLCLMCQFLSLARNFLFYKTLFLVKRPHGWMLCVFKIWVPLAPFAAHILMQFPSGLFPDKCWHSAWIRWWRTLFTKECSVVSFCFHRKLNSLQNSKWQMFSTTLCQLEDKLFLSGMFLALNERKIHLAQFLGGGRRLPLSCIASIFNSEASPEAFSIKHKLSMATGYNIASGCFIGMRIPLLCMK